MLGFKLNVAVQCMFISLKVAPQYCYLIQRDGISTTTLRTGFSTTCNRLIEDLLNNYTLTVEAHEITKQFVLNLAQT